MKASKWILNNGVFFNTNKFLESCFIRKFKNCLLPFSYVVFKNLRLLLVSCVQTYKKSDDWIFGEPNKFKILGLFSIIHVAMATTQFSP